MPGKKLVIDTKSKTREEYLAYFHSVFLSPEEYENSFKLDHLGEFVGTVTGDDVLVYKTLDKSRIRRKFYGKIVESEDGVKIEGRFSFSEGNLMWIVFMSMVMFCLILCAVNELTWRALLLATGFAAFCLIFGYGVPLLMGIVGEDDIVELLSQRKRSK